jgi:prepilin-type N-terminal cleavage/methylation domain-containing protein
VTVADLWKVKAMKRKKTGFTLVELLTVLAIITMLVGLLVPSMATVRRFARETKQKAQLATIDLALTAFRDEHGEYPPSLFHDGVVPFDYGGAQKLAEALVGWDLLGFHPASRWLADGTDTVGPGGFPIYDSTDPTNLQERKGPYLELATANAFKLGDLYGWGIGDTAELNANTYVLCDIFGVKELVVGDRKTKAGTPILYYQANLSSKIHDGDTDDSIYRHTDNQVLCNLPVLANPARTHRLSDRDYFYDEYIRDPKIDALPLGWPYRPTSYILISAGYDGEYGTQDDITNFGD